MSKEIFEKIQVNNIAIALSSSNYENRGSALTKDKEYIVKEVMGNLILIEDDQGEETFFSLNRFKIK